MATKANLEVTAPARQNNVAAFPAPGKNAAASVPQKGMRRVMTREQGRALETIGHAVDYLNDGNIHLGSNAEFLNVPGPSAAAIRILISARQNLLFSLPLVDPWHRRILNLLVRRKPRLQSTPW